MVFYLKISNVVNKTGRLSPLIPPYKQMALGSIPENITKNGLAWLRQ